MGLLSVVPILGQILDKVIPDPEERMKLQLELAKLADQEAARESAERIAQTEVNKVEASHSSIYVAGWRPGAGWVAVAAMAYTLIIAPVAGLPISDTPFLRDILLGMLGISVVARTVEKVKGVAENELNPKTLPPGGKPKKKVLGVEWPF